MKKTLKITNLCCPTCALKIENLISKIDGVDSVNLNFIAQKLTIVYDETKEKEVFEKVLKNAKKIESDVEILGI